MMRTQNKQSTWVEVNAAAPILFAPDRNGYMISLLAPRLYWPLPQERTMFVSFTDWEFDGNVDNAMEAAKGFWPSMKEHGATNLRVTVTGEKTLRTMTIWSDEEELKANIDQVRAAAGSAVGMTVTGGMMGPLAMELD